LLAVLLTRLRALSCDRPWGTEKFDTIILQPAEGCLLFFLFCRKFETLPNDGDGPRKTSNEHLVGKRYKRCFEGVNAQRLPELENYVALSNAQVLVSAKISCGNFSFNPSLTWTDARLWNQRT